MCWSALPSHLATVSLYTLLSNWGSGILNSCSSHMCRLQGTREVEGLVFQMTSDLGKLKRKVDLLGSAKDTLQHRCVTLTHR
jgi:hypothetical protein